MDSIFKLGILLSVVDKVSGPFRNIDGNIQGLKARLNSLDPAFDKFKTYGPVVGLMGSKVASALGSTVMATVETQKALGELSSVGITNLSALEQAGAAFSSQWSGTTKAEFIAAAYDIKSGIFGILR